MLKSYSAIGWSADKREETSWRKCVLLVAQPNYSLIFSQCGGTHNVLITLVALHHGELPLPRASVTPLPITSEVTMGSVVLPGCETYQEHGACKVLVLPRGGRSTYVVEMDGDE
jgi:hypothetical protein